MTRRVQNPRLVVAESDWPFAFVVAVNGRRLFDREAEHHPGPHRILIQKEIIFVEVNRRAEGPLGFRHSRYVIDVSMGQQDVGDRELLRLDEVQELVDLVAGIDEDGLLGPLAPDHIAVLEERTYRRTFNDHLVERINKIESIGMSAALDIAHTCH